MTVAMVAAWLVGWVSGFRKGFRNRIKMPYVCYILSIMISKTAVDDDVYSSRYAFVAFPSVIARISLILNPIIQFCMAKVYFFTMRIHLCPRENLAKTRKSALRRSSS